jgi:hypothetical protein
VVYASDRYRAAEAGFNDNHIYEELSLDNSDRTIAMVRSLTGEGNRIFRLWEDLPDKVPY